MIVPTVKIFPYAGKEFSSASKSAFFWRMTKSESGQEIHIFLSVEARSREETEMLSGELWALATSYLSEISLNLGGGDGRIINPEVICEGMLKNFNDYLAAWAEKSGLDDWNRMAIFLGVMNPIAFYFAKIGEGGAVLFRNKNLIPIDENLKTPRSPEFSPPFPEIAGGKLQSGDRVIIGSIGFFKFLSQGEVVSLIDSQPFEVATRNLERVSESVNENSSAGFIMSEISFREENENYFFAKTDSPGFNFSQVGAISFWEFNSLKEGLTSNGEKKSGVIPVKETIGALREKVTSPLLESILSAPKTIFSKFNTLSPTRRIILAAVFVILLFLGGYWNYSFSKRNQATADKDKLFEDKMYDYDKIFVAVDKLEDEAESALIYKDEEKAKKSLFEATEMLAKITSSGDYGIRAMKMKKEIEEKMASMEKNDIFVNSETLWTSPEGKEIRDFVLANGESALALVEGSIYSFSRRDGKNEEKIASSDDFKAEKSFFLKSKLETLFLSAGEKDFWSVDSAKNKLSAKKTVKQDDFQRSKPADAFDNYVYFWNQASKQFKQYNFQNGELVFYRDWLKESPNYFEEEGYPIDMAVDGNIFAISAKGQIWRFSGGKKIDWKVETPVRPLVSEKLKIATSDDSLYVYVLDSSKQRIAVFAKETGKLRGQIKNVDLGEAIAFRVDESKKEIYFNKPKEIRKIVFELPKEE